MNQVKTMQLKKNNIISYSKFLQSFPFITIYYILPRVAF